jgi:hypothetical protein
MRRNTSVQRKMSMAVCSVLMLIAALAANPTVTLAGETKVQRLVFVSAGFNEGNRSWIWIRRPASTSPAWLRSGNRVLT